MMGSLWFLWDVTCFCRSRAWSRRMMWWWGLCGSSVTWWRGAVCGQIEGLEQEADVVSQMMDLMEEYQTPIPPEYIAEFNVRRSYITVVLGLHVNHRLCVYLHVSFSRLFSLSLIRYYLSTKICHWFFSNYTTQWILDFQLHQLKAQSQFFQF